MNAPKLRVDETIDDLEALVQALRSARERASTPESLERQISSVMSARQILAQRRGRAKSFDGYSDLFGEPAYDILLDLYVAAHASRRVTVTSACIASGVPATTGLRYIQTLVDRKLLIREPCAHDRRSSELSLTELAMGMIERHLAP